MYVIKKIIDMETAVITPRNIPYIPKRAQTPVKPLSSAETRRLRDEYAISLIDEALKEERVSFEEVMNSLSR